MEVAAHIEVVEMAGAGNCPDLGAGHSQALDRLVGESLAAGMEYSSGGGGGWAGASCLYFRGLCTPGMCQRPSVAAARWAACTLVAVPGGWSRVDGASLDQ
jgi:hypothetical protein